ncbi:MAG: hypothetical protein JWN04_3833 [Myxococcaceae bacterium]|nr:hypothetical protein [Myxococcaceae bacterium]
MHISLWLAAALCAAALLPVHAHADSVYEESVAAAVVEFDRGNWEEAQALFRRAHNVAPNARTWRSLGVCAFELRQYVEATADLEAALIDPRKPLTDEQRKQVESLLARSRAFVSTYHVQVMPQNAEVIVDGKPVVLNGDTLHLDPGPHNVVVRARGYEERRAEFRAGAGTQDELSIQLSLANNDSNDNPEGPQASAPRAAPAAPVEAPPKRRRIWTWSLAGGSVAAAAVAVGLRLRVRNEHADYIHCRAEAANPTSCNGLRDQGQRLLHATYGVAAISAALAVGATVSFFLERERPSGTPSAALHVGPNGLSVSGAF